MREFRTTRKTSKSPIVDQMKRDKAEEWRLKGYDEYFIEKGIKWAENYTFRTVEWMSPPDEAAKQILEEAMMPKALEMAEKYITTMME